jgi:hypothetical protein
VAVAFLSGFGLGARSGTGGVAQKDTRVTGLAAIEKLHKADVDATLTQDPNALNALWSEGGVKLDVPGSPVVGLSELRELYEKLRVDFPDFKVIKYARL